MDIESVSALPEEYQSYDRSSGFLLANINRQLLLICQYTQ